MSDVSGLSCRIFFCFFSFFLFFIVCPSVKKNDVRLCHAGRNYKKSDMDLRKRKITADKKKNHLRLLADFWRLAEI